MKTGKLRSFWIIVRSIFATLVASLTIIWYGRHITRAQADATIQHWAKKLLDIVAIKLTVKNPHQVKLEPHQRYVIMSNHSSLYDIPVILRSFNDSVRMIAKTELYRVPIWGRAMSYSGFIEIDRSNTTQAMAALEKAKEKMQNGIVPWIAPEGTRSADGRLGPFKKGGIMMALQTNAIIIPVSIQGTHQVLPKKSLCFTTGAEVIVTIGEPIDSNNYTRETRDELMHKVREQIAAHLSS